MKKKEKRERDMMTSSSFLLATSPSSSLFQTSPSSKPRLCRQHLHLSQPPLYFSLFIFPSHMFFLILFYFFIAGYLPSLEHWKPQNLIVIPLSRYLLPSSPNFLLHFLPVIVWFAGARSLEQVGSMFWWSIIHSGHWSRAFSGYIRKKSHPCHMISIWRGIFRWTVWIVNMGSLHVYNMPL